MTFQKPKPIQKLLLLPPAVKPVPVVLPPAGRSSRPHSLRLRFLDSGHRPSARNTCALAVFLLSRGVCVGEKRVAFCANFHHWHCAVEERVSVNCSLHHCFKDVRAAGVTLDKHALHGRLRCLVAPRVARLPERGCRRRPLKGVWAQEGKADTAACPWHAPGPASWLCRRSRRAGAASRCVLTRAW